MLYLSFAVSFVSCWHFWSKYQITSMIFWFCNKIFKSEAFKEFLFQHACLNLLAVDLLLFLTTLFLVTPEIYQVQVYSDLIFFFTKPLYRWFIDMNTVHVYWRTDLDINKVLLKGIRLSHMQMKVYSLLILCLFSLSLQ